jgi:dihydroorotate dehydrogenase (fumarate)
MDTTTSYLGLRLANPFVAGASPFGYRVDAVKRLEDAGAGAVVLHSLFEEQITLADDGRIAQMDPSDAAFAETYRYFPASGEYALSPYGYAEQIRRLKQAVRIPVIASLNGRTTEAWLRFATIIEQAGADALELNLYHIETDAEAQGASIESRLCDMVRQLTGLVRMPIAVKLSPYFTALANVARRLDEAGAAGLVMFNRVYQPDIDPETEAVVPRVELSTSSELLLRLRWLAILHGRVGASLIASGGIATPGDGIKAILAGADAVQMVSALLRHGPGYLEVMRRGLAEWMDRHQVERLRDVCGRASLRAVGDRSAFERAHYIRTLQSWRLDAPDRHRDQVSVSIPEERVP